MSSVTGPIVVPNNTGFLNNLKTIIQTSITPIADLPGAVYGSYYGYFEIPPAAQLPGKPFGYSPGDKGIFIVKINRTGLFVEMDGAGSAPSDVEFSVPLPNNFRQGLFTGMPTESNNRMTFVRNMGPVTILIAMPNVEIDRLRSDMVQVYLQINNNTVGPSGQQLNPPANGDAIVEGRIVGLTTTQTVHIGPSGGFTLGGPDPITVHTHLDDPQYIAKGAKQYDTARPASFKSVAATTTNPNYVLSAIPQPTPAGFTINNFGPMTINNLFAGHEEHVVGQYHGTLLQHSSDGSAESGIAGFYRLSINDTNEIRFSHQNIASLPITPSGTAVVSALPDISEAVFPLTSGWTSENYAAVAAGAIARELFVGQVSGIGGSAFDLNVTVHVNPHVIVELHATNGGGEDYYSVAHLYHLMPTDATFAAVQTTPLPTDIVETPNLRSTRTAATELEIATYALLAGGVVAFLAVIAWQMSKRR